MSDLNPSRLYLPKLDAPPATIVAYLAMRFPQVSLETWLDRIARGGVRTIGGRTVTPQTPYAHGLTITYHRETRDEPRVPFEERIVYRDEHIIVADKPHFLPVTPGGAFVEECLLARLQRSTGLRDLAPVHRIDRDTAGLVLFAIIPSDRALYHRLFSDEVVHKEYVALAHVPIMPVQHEWQIDNRLEAGEPWYRQKVTSGESNASTHVRLLEWSDGIGEFVLTPRTGRKHQLRVHMASLGYPIVNDVLYPDVTAEENVDYSRPLQLIASRLDFRDPVSGSDLSFASTCQLDRHTVSVA